MRNSLLFLVMFCLAGVAFGQTKPASTPSSSKDCFKDWYQLFKERGADPIPDGTHEVIITIRNGDFSDCFLGKIDVAGGILSSPLSVQKVNGTYEEFDKRVSAAYQGADNRLKSELRQVVDGMSSSVQLEDGEWIRLFFYKSLKAKAIANKRAPSPSQLVKSN